jgi:hypothetical protein
MSSDEPIDGVALELTCPCGYENFERVVVSRKPHAAVVTDFVACVGCRPCTGFRFGHLVPCPRVLAMK